MNKEQLKEEIYNPFESMTFTNDRCFLCGVSLDNENKSVEHIFPKWLQNRYDLWNAKLTILNKETITYKHLTIPCCKPCNNIHLKKIEDKVDFAVKNGFDEFKKLDNTTIAQWLMKIKYGLLFKELSLKSDIRNPESQSILNSKDFDDFKVLYTFLQSVRFESKFDIQKPWSILKFQLLSENEKEYFGHDFIPGKMFCMQMGEIGIIACFQDNGMHGDFFKSVSGDFLNFKLHPIQFKELCARVHYKSSIVEINPKYLTSFTNHEEGKMSIMSVGESPRHIKEWENEEYAAILSFHLYGTIDKKDSLYHENGEVSSWLYSMSGNIAEYNSLEIGDFKER
jgi:hypothetical protein